jgi:hypothetical protein
VRRWRAACSNPRHRAGAGGGLMLGRKLELLDQNGVRGRGIAGCAVRPADRGHGAEADGPRRSRASGRAGGRAVRGLVRVGERRWTGADRDQACGCEAARRWAGDGARRGGESSGT